jgi:hypothetical protein
MTISLTSAADARPPAVDRRGSHDVTYGGSPLGAPALEQQKVVPDVARWARAAGTTAASYRPNRWNTAFRFYVGRHVAMIDAPDEARALFNGDEPFYCTMLGPAYDRSWRRRAAADRLRARRDVGRRAAPVAPQAPPTRFVVVTASRDLVAIAV